MTLTLENGKTFTVTADNSSPENPYIQSAELNGKELVMGPQPNKKCCTSKDAAPYSLSK